MGSLRYQSAQPKFPNIDLASYQPLDEASVTGVIISYPEISSGYSTAIVRAESIAINGEEMPVNGKLELRLPGGFHLAYGDRLLLVGELRPSAAEDTPFYSSYLSRRGIHSRMFYPKITWLAANQGNMWVNSIFQLRTRAHNLLIRYLPLRESTLLSGILLGIDWLIPRYLEDAYRATGTIHIIAISGFNITLLAWQIIHLFRRFFYPLPAALLAILAISFYTLLVGAEPSVIRAAVMGSLAIPAYFLGRRIIGVHSLTITATIMLAFNPLLLWDIGFQLSFLATLGLMTLADPAIEFLTQRIDARWGEVKANQMQPLLILIIPTLAAQLAVSPVLLALNDELHIYSLPANLLILPLQPLIMMISGLGLLVGLLLPPLGGLFLSIVRPFAAFSNQIAIRIGLLPGAVFQAPEYSPVVSLILVSVILVIATIVQIKTIGHSEPDDG
jgi:competence protein ComEC